MKKLVLSLFVVATLVFGSFANAAIQEDFYVVKDIPLVFVEDSRDFTLDVPAFDTARVPAGSVLSNVEAIVTIALNVQFTLADQGFSRLPAARPALDPAVFTPFLGTQTIKFDAKVSLGADLKEINGRVIDILLGEAYQYIGSYYASSGFENPALVESFTIAIDDAGTRLTGSVPEIAWTFNDDRFLEGLTTTAFSTPSGSAAITYKYTFEDAPPATTPEPATMLLFGLGALAIPVARRFRNK